MSVVTMEDIIESNRMKKEGLETIKRDLKGIMSQEELNKIEQVYKAVTKNYMLQKKRKGN